MRKMLKLLIVLMICLSLSACGTWNCPEPEYTIEHVYHYTSCGKEQVPNYVELDPEKHVGSADNVNALLSNLEGNNGYIQGLNKIIDCYEKQVKKSETTNE